MPTTTLDLQASTKKNILFFYGKKIRKSTKIDPHHDDEEKFDETPSIAFLSENLASTCQLFSALCTTASRASIANLRSEVGCCAQWVKITKKIHSKNFILSFESNQKFYFCVLKVVNFFLM